MSGLVELLERAAYDIEQGWVEAAIDAFGRAVRIVLEDRDRQMFAKLDEIIIALPKRKLSALDELNEFRGSDSRRLDDALRAILAATPGWPSAKEVRRDLQQAAFHPLPGVRTVCGHLLEIRGKRHDTVGVVNGASVAPARAILQT
jgi:hypothetical protein